MLWFIVVVLFSLSITNAKQRRPCRGLAEFDAFLRDTQTHLECGAVDFRQTNVLPIAQPPASCLEVLQLFDACRRQGQSVRSSIDTLRFLVTDTAKNADKCTHIWRLFCYRVGLGLTLALIGRATLLTAIQTSNAANSLGYGDHLALMLAAALVVMTLVCVLRLLPSTWLWSECLTSQGRIWLQSYLAGRAVQVSVLGNELAALEKQEILTGVSLLAERRRRLVQFAKKKGSKMCQDLQRLEDFLPLFELLGIGLPATLLLLMPILNH